MTFDSYIGDGAFAPLWFGQELFLLFDLDHKAFLSKEAGRQYNTSEIIRLRSEILELQNNSLPHCQDDESRELQCQLRGEITSLECNIRQLKSEQEQLHAERDTMKEKLRKTEELYVMWQDKALSTEEDVDGSLEKHQQQDTELQTLRVHCRELNTFLEEMLATNRCNESDPEVDISISEDRNLESPCEDLASAFVEVQMGDAQKENAELEDVLEESQESAKELNEELSSVKTHLEKLQTDYEILKADNEDILKKKMRRSLKKREQRKKKNNHKEIALEEMEVSLNIGIGSDANEKERKKHIEKVLGDSGNIDKVKHNISSDSNGELPALGDEASKEKKHKKFPEEETWPDTDGSVETKKRRKHLQDALISHSLLQGSEKHKKAKKSRLDSSFTPSNDSLAKMKNKLDPKDSKGINVVIPFEVPQTHLIETRISNKPTQQQREQFKALKVTLKTRPYTNAEDTAIKANWEEFCRTHNIPNQPELFMSITKQPEWPPSKRIRFVQFLGRGLNDRMLYSIYTRFRVLFGTYKKGKFTPDEDKIILDFMESTESTMVKNKFATLATMLGRPGAFIKSHYQALLDNEKVMWSEELTNSLIDNLMRVLGTDDIEELETVAIDSSHWKELENVMGIPQTKLRRKWMRSTYPRLFAVNSDLTEVRKKLITLLYDGGKCDRKEINWKELALNFNGMSGTRLFAIFDDLVRMWVPKELKKSFKDTIEFLKNKNLVAKATRL